MLLDALARAYAAAVGWRVDEARTAQSLLREVGTAMLTGYQGGEGLGAEPLRALAAEAAAALTGHWRRDAWEGALTFGVAPLYEEVVTALQQYATCALHEAHR